MLPGTSSDTKPSPTNPEAYDNKVVGNDWESERHEIKNAAPDNSQIYTMSFQDMSEMVLRPTLER